MANQHRNYEDAQRGGRRDGLDRNDPQSWGHDGGRQYEAQRDPGQFEDPSRSAPDWQQERGGGRAGRSSSGPAESGGRQWGARDDRGVAEYSGGWSDAGRGFQDDRSTPAGAWRGVGGRGLDAESRGGFQGNDSGRGDDYGYGGERSSYGGGRQRFAGYGQPVSQGDGYGQRADSGLSYAGRGPKGYQRSDDRIREEIADRMTDDDRLDASEISIQVQQCEVTLTGTVSSREQKRRAEDLAEAISGVREVTNNIRVARENGAGIHTASSASSQAGQSGQGGQAQGTQSSSKTGTKSAGAGGPVS
jgi:hypothetical protein